MRTRSLQIVGLTLMASLLLFVVPARAIQPQMAPSVFLDDHAERTESSSRQIRVSMPLTGPSTKLADRINKRSVESKAIAAVERSLVITPRQETVPINWRKVGFLSPRQLYSIAYDSARGVVVLFGGYDGALRDDTWEWDGISWIRRDPAHRPSARQGQAMAYDSARGVVVLFGGDDAADQDDTWEWNGSDWIELSPIHRPPGRDRHAVAYDTVREVVVLFGGSNSTGYLDDTWEWDGSDWVQRSPANHPQARNGHAMAYDGAHGAVVLFGGNDNGTNRQDHWEWNGTNWVERSPATRPPGRRYHAMAYDTVRGVVVMFGGCCYQNDTWEWTGTTWVQRSPATPPPVRDGHAMAYDSGRGVVVLFGGWGGSSLLNDTWEWDGTNWTDRGQPSYPSPRYSHAMAYDSGREVAVLFGGSNSLGYLSDTWEWDGMDWVQRSPANSPSARDRHTMVYDSNRGVIVLFGGFGASGYQGDTWEWNGTNWVQRSPAHHPAGREGAGIAYDSARGMVVLFGGSNNSGRLNDTWEWNGSDWAQRSSGNSPSARHWLAMAYDSARQVVVLFGGWDGWYQDDTWEWNGTNWLERYPVVYPEARDAHAMAYDSATGAVVLFGGNNYNHLDDTWEWDGTNWQQRNPDDHPSARDSFAIVYDNTHEKTILFGGHYDSGGDVFLNDTWQYAPLVPRPILSPIENLDGDGEYFIEWSTVPIAISYTLEEDNTASFASPTVRYQGDQTQFQVSSQGSGDWYYRVKCSNSQGDSAWSNVELAGVRPPAPDLYPILNEDGDGTYLVDWSDATGATSYRLEEDDNYAFTSPTVRYNGAASQYQVSGQQGGTWYYRARASNTGGDSAWSNSELVGVVPAAPVLLAISNPDGNGDYVVDWSDVSGALTYRLVEDDNAAFTSPVVRYEGDSSQFTVTAQQPGLWYYRVRAGNATGDGPWSNVQSAGVLPEAPVLDPVSNPDGNGDYIVNWNDVAGATSYRLEEDDNIEFNSPTVRYNGTNSQFQVSGQPTGLWYYRVLASCAGGDSPWSNIESVSVAPAAPVLFPISNPDGNGDYSVHWSEVSGATSYRLEEDDNSAFTSSTVRYIGAGSEFQVYGQEAGVWYYRVLASNAYGDSPWSNTESVGVVPSAPTLLSIPNPECDGDYIVDWNDVPGAFSYQLQEDDNAAFTSPTLRYEGSSSQYMVTGQLPGVWYYRVLASNSGGDSPWSNIEWVGVCPAAPELEAISNPDGNGDYLVDWNDVSGAAGYELEEDDNINFDSPVSRYQGTNTQLEVMGQAVGSWYYRVRAFNAAGYGGWSQPRAVTVLAVRYRVYLAVVMRGSP